MTDPFIPTEADIVRTFAVLDVGLGRCACRQRPGILSDMDGQPLCAECAAGSQYDVQGNAIPTTTEAVVADVIGGLTDEEKAILNAPDITARFCRLCGCTELNPCIDDLAGSCWWVAADLCSHCPDTPTDTPTAITLVTSDEHGNWTIEPSSDAHPSSPLQGGGGGAAPASGAVTEGAKPLLTDIQQAD